MLAKVKDSEVYSLFEFTLELAEKLDLPIGFTDKDVNLDAPPLFTDTFSYYILCCSYDN